jgi:hypothetical protein
LFKKGDGRNRPSYASNLIKNRRFYGLIKQNLALRWQNLLLHFAGSFAGSVAAVKYLKT